MEGTEEIPATEFRRGLRDLLGALRMGEGRPLTVITFHGRPVALLTPYDETTEGE